MSVTICYEEVHPSVRGLGGTSSFLDKLARIAGYDRYDAPFELRENSLMFLRGLLIGTDDRTERESLDELIQAIESLHAVRVWGEY